MKVLQVIFLFIVSISLGGCHYYQSTPMVQPMTNYPITIRPVSTMIDSIPITTYEIQTTCGTYHYCE